MGRGVLPTDIQEALCHHAKVRYAVAVPFEDFAIWVSARSPKSRPPTMSHQPNC